MKKRNRRKDFTTETVNRFTLAAQSFIAALRDVGARMERANDFIAKARPMRGRDVEALSVAHDFRQKGRLYRCFFACCNALDSVHMCGAELIGKVKKKMKWFTGALNVYLGIEHVDCVAEFATLVYQMLDMSEPSSPAEVRSAKKRISLRGMDALHELGKQSTAREMKLCYSATASPNGAVAQSKSVFCAPEMATDLHELALDTNATVHRIDTRHKQYVARKKTSEEMDAMERMRKRNRVRFDQIAAVAEIMASKNTNFAQRRNYSAAAKRLFRDYKRLGKKVPVGGYPTYGALFQFVHKNKRAFYRLLEARAKVNGVELPAA